MSAPQYMPSVEVLNQALHECKMKMKIAESHVKEYEDEIQMLQSERDEDNKKFESKVQQLEDNILAMRTSHEERTNEMMEELQTKNEEIENLKRQLDDNIKISAKRQSRNDESLNETGLKHQNLELQEKVDELENSWATHEKRCLNQQEIITQLQEELENYKMLLSSKKDELQETNTLFQNLKDDYMCIKAELDLTRNKPLVAQAKGNSLFAEVDDRRVQLQDNMNLMKSKYLEMKRERASHLKEITILRNQNSALMARWEAEIDEKKTDEDMVLESYKNQILTLKYLIENCEKELKAKAAVPLSSGMKFFDNLLASKNKDIEALREKLSSVSLNESIVSHDLAEARREIRKHTVAKLKLQNEIGQLKIKIEELQLRSPIEKEPQIKEERILKSIIKKDPDQNTTEIKEPQQCNPVEMNKDPANLDEANKEHSIATDDKKVQFTETTKDSKITQRKRGARTYYSKPIHVSSVPTGTS